MANKFARSNGDFNGPIWALTSGGVAGSTTAPTIGDNAIANTFTVQITGNVSCDNITNGTAYGGTGGGRFDVFSSTNNISISANVSTTYFGSFVNYTTYACLSVTNPQTTTIFGNLSALGTTANHTVIVDSLGSVNVYGNLLHSAAGGNFGSVPLYCSRVNTLNVYGNINGGTNNSSFNTTTVGLRNVSNGLINIYGSITAGYNNEGVLNQATSGFVTVYGNVNGSNNTATSQGISNTSTGSVTVYGNLNGSTASALSNTSTGSVTVVGNVLSDSRGGAGITSSNAAANVKISGNLIGAPNGIPAVYAASYTVNPVPYQTYIRYANNGTGVGSDAYLYHYTTDSLSAFSIPPLSAVRAGLQYANNTLTGTCEIPAASAVTFGALVDNTTGTAVLTSNNLFDVSVASLTATNSLGERLKNSATVESVGKIIASFSN